MPQSRRRRVVFLATAGVVLALGAWTAAATRWYCDDIFITLRYAQQFLAGHGFVYNVGERVEGYTHFLWLLIITAFERAGADPVGVVVWGGVASFAGTLAVFLAVSRRLAPKRAVFVVPFTALALVANRECRIWATSGLETFFYTLLLSLAFYVEFFSRAGARRRLVTTSFLLVLAAMTRPDGLLVYGIGAVFVAARALLRVHDRLRRFATDAALYALPFVVVYLPYVAWKMSFYGSFFPNTYYAKSGYLPYYSQGFYYLWTYLRAHPSSGLVIAALPALALVMVKARKRDGAPAGSMLSSLDRENAAALVAFVVVGAYLVGFVARVGGDFMFARFVVPMLPFVYFLVEWTLSHALARSRILRTAALVAILVAVVAETPWCNHLMIEVKDGVSTPLFYRGVVDEHSYYTQFHVLTEDRRAGELLRPVFDGLDATVLLGGQACFGYYAGFRTLIEGAGLTDSTIAHQSVTRRGRVGHEKQATYDYLIERGVNFRFSRKPFKDDDYRLFGIVLPGNVTVAGEIITYDPHIMRQLAAHLGRSIRFTPFESYLDYYIARELPAKTHDDLAKDFEDFKEFYFDHNKDPKRADAFRSALENRR